MLNKVFIQIICIFCFCSYKDLRNRHHQDDFIRSLNSQIGRVSVTKSGSLWDEEPTPTPPPRSRRRNNSPDFRAYDGHTRHINMSTNNNNFSSRHYASESPSYLQVIERNFHINLSLFLLFRAQKVCFCESALDSVIEIFVSILFFDTRKLEMLEKGKHMNDENKVSVTMGPLPVGIPWIMETT